MDKRTTRQTDRRHESNLVHFSLKSDIWWQYFNDFPDNQLTKFRVNWLILDIYLPLEFL